MNPEDAIRNAIDATISEAREATGPDAAFGLDIARILIADGTALKHLSAALQAYQREQNKRGGFIATGRERARFYS